MPYRPSRNLDEALKRLEDAKYIPGWSPLTAEYDSAIHGESNAGRLDIVAVNLCGVLRHVRLLRATNPLLRNADAGLKQRGEDQIKLGLARQDVMRQRLLAGLVVPRIIISDAAFAEVIDQGPEVVSDQRALLADAADSDWEISVVPRAAMLERVGDPEFVCAFTFGAMPDRADGAYWQVEAPQPPEPSRPYEFYTDAPGDVGQSLSVYRDLAAVAVPYESRMFASPGPL